MDKLPLSAVSFVLARKKYGKIYYHFFSISLRIDEFYFESQRFLKETGLSSSKRNIRTTPLFF